MTDTITSSDVSSPQKRRIVVTGLGVVNPLGVNVSEFWAALAEGRSGIGPIDLFDASELPVRFAGQIPDFNAKKFIDKKERKNLRVMARSIQLAVAGAQVALDDAELDKEKIDPARFGVEFGAGLMATDLGELAGAAEISGNCKPGQVDLVRWGDQGMERIPPLWMLKYLPNMLACQVSILHNAQGPNNSITEGEVGGLLAIGEAYRIISRDGADFFLAGGADSKINPLSMVRQCLFGALSQRNDDPQKACRPFDANRDGMVVGESSGVLALEELSHAEKRSAKIYAEVIGFGAAFDGGTGQTATGLARAMQAALREANIRPDELDHVSAHGVSSVSVDAWEAKGITLGLGDAVKSVPVVAAKSYFGNAGSAGAPTEWIASLIALHHGKRLGTRNYETPDAACGLQLTSEMQDVSKPYVMKIAFTDMGQCAALVCRKWD